jgi:glycosyltransferase involved in cell wall biosynthesis
MKILQIGNIDTEGARFNGTDLHQQLLKRGMNSELCVWDKRTDDKNTWQMVDFRQRKFVHRTFKSIEKLLSMQSVFYPFSFLLPFDERFRSVDIVHYHLIHTGYFSLASLPLLTYLKPSIWTLHDPWALTGHCIYPFDCEKWKNGCGECPRLETPIAVKRDRTALMWKTKKLMYHASQIEIVVASKWMFNMVKQSPLFSESRLHLIPFGLDLNVFRPYDSQIAKKQLGVFPGSIVIAFRATNSEYKGLPFIKECLHRLKKDIPICLLTFNDRGLLDEFRGRYQLIDLGWVNDVDIAVKAYNATDIFLMPSSAEAFGLMAIEAMACGKPVIVFNGTALSEVVFAPQGGIAVPYRDTDALFGALERLVNRADERLQLGQNALNLARQHYDIKSHVNRMIDLYRDLNSKKSKRLNENF